MHSSRSWDLHPVLTGAGGCKALRSVATVSLQSRSPPHLLSALQAHQPSSACWHMLSVFTPATGPLCLQFPKTPPPPAFHSSFISLTSSRNLCPLSNHTPCNAVTEPLFPSLRGVCAVRAGLSGSALHCIPRPAQRLRSEVPGEHGLSEVLASAAL